METLLLFSPWGMRFSSCQCVPCVYHQVQSLSLTCTLLLSLCDDLAHAAKLASLHCVHVGGLQATIEHAREIPSVGHVLKWSQYLGKDTNATPNPNDLSGAELEQHEQLKSSHYVLVTNVPSKYKEVCEMFLVNCLTPVLVIVLMMFVHCNVVCRNDSWNSSTLNCGQLGS